MNLALTRAHFQLTKKTYNVKIEFPLLRVTEFLFFDINGGGGAGVLGWMDLMTTNFKNFMCLVVLWFILKMIFGVFNRKIEAFEEKGAVCVWLLILQNLQKTKIYEIITSCRSG